MFKNAKWNDLRPALSLKEQPWLLGGACWGQQAITNKQTNKTKQNKQRFSLKAAFTCELCVTKMRMRNDFDRPLHMNSADYIWLRKHFRGSGVHLRTTFNVCSETGPFKTRRRIVVWGTNIMPNFCSSIETAANYMSYGCKSFLPPFYN